MDAVTILADAFDRVRGSSARAVEGLDLDALTWQPDDAANTIAWLVWHLARVQDDHVADVAGSEQVWDEGDWAGRFGLAADTRDTGFGHGPDDVRAVRPDGAETLVAYLDAVTDRTRAFLEDTGAEDLDRIVDENWDPPGDAGRPPGQRHRRRAAARRAGRLRTRPVGTPLTSPGQSGPATVTSRA